MMISMLGRKSALWLAAAISVLSFATATSASAEEPCNGAVELCGRTLDQVVLPGTHNSMSNEEYGWIIPNQHYSIPTQLTMGIRAFLIDTHYGKAGGDGSVSNVAKANRNDPGVEMYLCHERCGLGASKLIPELSKVRDFLAANPREVMVFVVQDGLVPEDLAEAVTESGLISYVYTGSISSYPTLSQMIATNQRVVMLSEGDTGDVPWYHNGYAGPMQETPYDFRKTEAGDAVANTRAGMDLLTQSTNLNSSCRPNRGNETGSLFLMNHWVNGKLDEADPLTPDPEVAKILNQKSVLVNRARACQERRGKLPTILAVDDFGDGDLLGAVDELNGVVRAEPEPEPQPIGVKITVKKPSRVSLRAGKVALFRVRVTNTGDSDSARFRVCAKAPDRLARRSSCALVKVKAGESAIARVRILTRSRAKGKGLVKFTVFAPGGKLTTSADLIVRKKPKSRR